MLENLNGDVLPSDPRELIAHDDQMSEDDLIELLCCDQVKRWRAGERIPAEAYLALHPTLNGGTEGAFELVYGEYLVRELMGEPPKLNEFLWRFPKFAERLERQLNLHRALTLNENEAEEEAEGETAQDAMGSAPELPGYEVQGELGRGGMSVVYLARQVALNRLVALKVIRAKVYADPMVAARFRAEAEAAARLQHLNIVQVHEVGEFDGQGYLVLEYADGGSLEQKLAATPQPPRASAELVEALARALHYAHLQGIVHRDLKPANVVLTRDGLPKVADFGLAKLLEREGGLTQTGDIMGTPSYMAPEQAQGTPSDATPATDVYALGAILYEMLTGRPPFKGATPLSTLSQVTGHEPVAPGKLQRHTPRELETICLKCLEKEPRKRYGSAAELGDDLRRFLENRPILARRNRVSELCWRWCRREPVKAGLIAALLCAFLAGALGVAIQWLRAEEKARAESVARANAEAEQDRALNNLYFSRIAQARLEWRLNNTVGAQQLLEYCDPARRGWEWHYLSNLSRCEIFGLRSTELSYVVSVTFSPDGSQFAFTGFDPYRPPDTQRVSPVEIWDARTCERIQTLAGPEHALRLSYSPDGRRLVASSGREAKIWNLESGRLERAWFPNGTVTFSQDGRSLVSADSAGVAISNAETGEIIRRFSSKVGRALFSPDGRIVAVSGIDAVVLFDATSGQVLQTLQHGTSDSEAQSTRFFTPEGPEIAFSPDCERVAVATFPPRIWEVRSGQILHQLSGHNGAVNGIAFSPDGQLVATGGIDSTVRVWNAANGGEQAVLRGHAAFVGCVAFHPDGWSLVSGGRHIGEVKLWDLTRPQESTNLPETGAAGIAFDPDGDHIKLVSPTGRIKVRASDSGTTTLGPVVELNMRWMTPAAMTEWSSDARMLATVARDRQQIKLWNMNAPATPVTLTGLTAPASYLAISSSGDRVAAAGLFAKDRSRFREIMVWDTGSGKPLARFSPALAATTFTHGRVALSPDGSRVAFDDYKLSSAAPSQPSESVTTSELRICEVTSGREILRIPLGESVIYCLAFSHDGKLIAAGDDDGQLCVIDAESGRVLKRQRQSQSLFRLAFSPDGRRLAGINREKVQIWNIPDLQDVLVLRGAQPRSLDGGFNPVMAWSQDGRQLASLNWDGSISVWNGSERPNLVADRVKEATSRIFAWHLTQAESAISRQQPASALRHLSRLMISKPPDVSSLLRRAQLSLRLGRWEESGDDFAAWLKAGAPADDCASASYGRLLVARGDHAGYEQLCQHSIDALRKDTNAETAWSAVGVFALAPGSSADAATVLQIAERQIPVEVRTVEQAYALALVAYRAGNFDVADKRLRSFADHHDLWSARTRPLRAMLDYHLGHVNRAREELARAIAWASDQTSGATATAPAGERAISELLMDFQALCREGQALLDQSNEAKASSVKKTS